MKALFLMLLFLINSSLYAQSFQERMDEAYLNTDKNFDIDCRYSFNKTFQLLTALSTTTKTSYSIERDFLLDNGQITAPMHFSLKKKDGKYHYFITVDQQLVSSGRLGKRDFYITPFSNTSLSKTFESSQIFCSVNFAYEKPFTLKDGNYHINVHPHKRYDWQSLLKDSIESYLANKNFESLILLDTGNYRGNLVDIDTFLSGREYSLPQNDYPSDLVNVPRKTPLLVSPAGHNRYKLEASNELNITFTGGNHNYCIWNNTRRVLESLMYSKSLAQINIYYDAQSTVAQQRGIEGMSLNFPRKSIKKSNRLADLLRDNRDVAIRYHKTYYNYFKTFFFNEFKGMFQTVKLTYKSNEYQVKDLIEGNGVRQLEINLIYINQ